jgi:ATP-dependent DNA ligase
MENIKEKGLVRLYSLELYDRFSIYGTEYTIVEHMAGDLHICKCIIDGEIVIAPGIILVELLEKFYT